MANHYCLLIFCVLDVLPRRVRTLVHHYVARASVSTGANGKWSNHSYHSHFACKEIESQRGEET